MMAAHENESSQENTNAKTILTAIPHALDAVKNGCFQNVSTIRVYWKQDVNIKNNTSMLKFVLNGLMFMQYDFVR